MINIPPCDTSDQNVTYLVSNDTDSYPKKRHIWTFNHNRIVHIWHTFVNTLIKSVKHLNLEE